ncbi:MAG: hydroxyacid dehydrogenase [Flavobacteriia bacterium]|nr:MAG: hydroxyacid dehydrogenase [Flavobacteriia bacterium]
MSKVLLLDDNHPLLKHGLEGLGYTCIENFTASKAVIKQQLPDYKGIVIRSRFKIDRPFIDAGTQLKFIARVGAGLENIDVSYARNKGIHLVSAPEGNRNAVGEHTLGMLLSLLNHLNRADRQIRQGQWLREPNRGIELDGKTVGIIGYGNMGKSFAKKLKGFDVEVICYDILSGVGDANATQVSLAEFQKRADIVSLHVPHNDLSYKMVNTDFIKRFAKPFFLLNTARGTVVETTALVEGLKNGKILGAGLDVLEYEKTSFEQLFAHGLSKKEEQQSAAALIKNEDTANQIPEAFQYLTQADHVLLSPHVAGWTHESKIKLASVIVEKIKHLELNR